MALTLHGNPYEAIDLIERALQWGRRHDDRWGTVWALHAMAWALAETLAPCANPAEVASVIAFLLGGAEQIRELTRVALPALVPFAKATQRAADLAQERLDPTTYQQEYDRGLQAPQTEILAAALGESYSPESATRTQEPWDTLTTVQKEIALLAAEGLRNRDIASAGNRSPRTVETHITQILQKLGISDRRQIVAMIPDRLDSDSASDTPSAGRPR
jgi:DNA-binding CsgD family transcriptional regulator